MIRALTKADLTGLNKLSPPEWNFDLESFIDGFMDEEYFYAFVLVQDEKVVGLGNAFLKDKVGWLANIIVDSEYRCKGLGYKMTKYLVDFLVDIGCETQLLVATELGAYVYQKIGFRKITDYVSFDSEVDTEFIATNSIRRLSKSDLESIYKLDMDTNDEDRKHLIDRSYETGSGYFNDNNELIGFYLPDFGRGLVLAKDCQVGVQLLKLKHSEKGRSTLIPLENEIGINFLENYGLKKGDKSSRMIFGKENDWNPKYIYSYGSGYCG